LTVSAEREREKRMGEKKAKNQNSNEDPMKIQWFPRAGKRAIVSLAFSLSLSSPLSLSFLPFFF
jgi:hypothetical protein